MRYLILLLLFITLSANECNMPYNAKTVYKDSRAGSHKLTLDSNLELTFNFSDLDWRHHFISVAVFCDIRNPNQTVEILQRNLFSAVSSHGILFKMYPMQVANNLKVSKVPDEYPVA